jgi:hypothetical protein
MSCVVAACDELGSGFESRHGRLAMDSNLGMGGGFASGRWSRAGRGGGFLLGRWRHVPASAVGWAVMGGLRFLFLVLRLNEVGFNLVYTRAYF